MKKIVHFCGLSTAIIKTLRFHQIKKMAWSILTLLFLFVSIESWAQNNGDFQSNPTAPINVEGVDYYYWNNPLNWQVYSGGSWGTTSNYPGENDKPNDDVKIQEAHTITLDKDNNLDNPSGTMGEITIDGKLHLIGEKNKQIEFSLNTLKLTVTHHTTDDPPELLLIGVIEFTDKVKLILRELAIIDVISYPDPDPTYWGLVVDTSCNHNQDIQIGDLVIAFCQGAPGAALTFAELMANGGSLRPIITYTPIDCATSKISITGQLFNNGLTYDLDINSFVWGVSKDGGSFIEPAGIVAVNDTQYFNLEIDEESIYVIKLILSGTDKKTSKYYTAKQTTVLFGQVKWNGTSWGNFDLIDEWLSLLPQYAIRAIINEVDYNMNDLENTPNAISFSTCSMTVTAKNLTIAANTYVEVYNDIKNDGTIVVEHEGSLVQVNETDTNSHPGSDPPSTGTYKIKKTTRPYTEYDYTYWSSPVVGETIENVFINNSEIDVSEVTGGTTGGNHSSPASCIYWFNTANFDDANADGFDDNNNDWQPASGSMLRGKGYIAMGAGADFPFSTDFATGIVQKIYFSDTRVNNGSFGYSVVKDANNGDGFHNENLIGNPYPSAIDLVELMAANTAILGGTFYFWTHDSPISSENDGPWYYNFTNDDYAMATTDGTEGSFDNTVGGGTDGTLAPRYVASGQGFLATVDFAGSVNFTNAMRVTHSNNDFKNTQRNQDRFWLNMTNDLGVYRQIYIGFRENATDGFQNGQDGKRRPSVGNTDFYSIIPDDDGRFGIQNLATFNDSKTVALGLEIADAGEYVINIDRVEGIFATGQEVYLEDIYTNKLHNLTTDGEYVFSSVPGKAIKDRFILRFTEDKSAVKTTEQLLDALVIYPNPSNNIFNIGVADDETIDITVYDVSGKSLLLKNHTTTRQIDLSGYAPGFYFAKIQLDGQHIVKKLVLR